MNGKECSESELIVPADHVWGFNDRKYSKIPELTLACNVRNGFFVAAKV